MKTNELFEQVPTRKEAETVVAKLLKAYTTESAWDRLLNKAENVKQTPEELLRRVVSNLFTSLKTNKK